MLKPRVSFGLAKAKEVNKEEFNGKMVLLVAETPNKKGQTYKFQLSKAAVEFLNLNRKDKDDLKKVAFAFPVTEDGTEAFLANVTGISEVSESDTCNINMNGGFSSKPYFEAVKKAFNAGEEEVLFLLEDATEQAGITALSLIKSSREEINGELVGKIAEGDVESPVVDNEEVEKVSEPEADMGSEDDSDFTGIVVSND